jgi:hypothetical protein
VALASEVVNVAGTYGGQYATPQEYAAAMASQAWAQANHDAASAKVAYDDSVHVATTGVPVVAPVESPGFFGTLSSAFSGAPALRTSASAPAQDDRNAKLREAMAQAPATTTLRAQEQRQAEAEAEKPGFLDKLGDFAGRALEKINLPTINLGGGGSPLSVTTTPASSGGIDATGVALLGGAALVVVVLLVWK